MPPPPAVMGVVNVTPDSFSDGGRHLDPEAAVAHGMRLLEEGAAVLDVGAESTRPGARPVPPVEERERLLPVLRALRALTDRPISVDTRRAETARAALDLGADIVNDVSALRHDPDLAALVARERATLVLMHSRGTPRTMQQQPSYPDGVVLEVGDELEVARRQALEAGCQPDRIVLDPGLGFAKTLEHNLELVRGLPELARRFSEPLLVGASRKAMIGALLASDGEPRPVGERVHGSVGVALAAVAAGASWVRVHDVAATVDALRTFHACRARDPSPCREPQRGG